MDLLEYLKVVGTPGRIRTYDLELRSLLLYPTELPGHGRIITKETGAASCL